MRVLVCVMKYVQDSAFSARQKALSGSGYEQTEM